MTCSRLTGTYLLGLEPLLVSSADGRLFVSTPGVPQQFAARIVHDGDGFRIDGGPLDGAPLVFAEGDPSPGGVLGGVFEFTRAPEGMQLPGGRGLLPPPLDLAPPEEARYADLLEAIRSTPDGGLLDPGQPRWRFVEWLTRQDAVIFHGSPKDDIDVFAPVRTSVELMDHGGKGNLAAVYGTPFGLWAMWFAVLDRSRLEGSIRNGVLRWTDRTGAALDVYFFSVHHEHVGGDIWRRGMLYLLPRQAFRPNPFYPGGPDSSEWASPHEVTPLKRIAVDPEDFPFRDQVGGHDDSDVIRADQLAEIVLDKATGARRIAGGFELTLAWDDELADVFDEYLERTRRLLPDVERRLRREREGTFLEIRGSAGFLQSLEGALGNRGLYP